MLDVINELLFLSDSGLLSVKEITERFTERFAEESERKITNRWIGNVLRKRLGLKPYKSDGTFTIALTPKTRAILEHLAVRHGITLPAPAAGQEQVPPASAPPDDLTGSRL